MDLRIDLTARYNHVIDCALYEFLHYNDISLFSGIEAIKQAACVNLMTRMHQSQLDLNYAGARMIVDKKLIYDNEV